MTAHRDPDSDSVLELTTRVEISRRDALKLIGAGIAAAQAGCLQPPGEEVRPYVRRPPEVTPGVATYYASSMVVDGFATGLLVESHTGRPTKIEGNPSHPASLGATTPQHQAAIYDLYDPHRAKSLVNQGLPATWERARAELGAPGHGPLWLVMPPDGSPLVEALVARIRELHPGTRVVWHEPLDHRSAYRGAALAFGEPREVQLALGEADVVVALDADPLGSMPMSCRWAREWARRRRPATPGDDPGRLHVAEPMPTPTGTVADHRLAARPGDVPAVAILLLAELAARGVALPALPSDATTMARRRLAGQAAAATTWARAVAADLARSPGRGAVIVGDRQPPACHAIGHWINQAIGAVGRTVTLTAPARIDPLGDAELSDLAAALRDGAVGTLVVLDANPIYTGPAALGLEAGFRALPRAFHATLHRDETSAACAWTLPLSHWLESWGDGRAYDGTVSFVQPLIQPLYGTPSRLAILGALAGLPVALDDLGLLRGHWKQHDRGLTDDAAWREVLAEGFLPGSALPARPGRVGAADRLTALLPAALGPRDGDALEVALAPSPVHDGRFSSNAWLQELPRPVTKQTWGNAACLGRATAAALGVGDGDELRLRAGRAAVAAPVLIVPGHAEGCVTLDAGYGRRTPDQPIADGLGADAFALLSPGGGPIVQASEAVVTGRHRNLARTQVTWHEHDRDVAPVATLAHWRANPDFTEALRGPLPTLLADKDRSGVQWAMTIDTTICTGCSSCVIACQAENNVPVVGAAEVRRGREMHWLRVDCYVVEDTIVHQPMLCQHCEHAPCEYVCPVFATVHSPDGLNEMVYNRCIGTRFCSNNCPYKVRRFNWFEFNKADTTLALQRNPEVTVRARGVMEKCTYCVQRIRGAEHQAKVQHRDIRPGEVVTACQQACPTGAIQFGMLGERDAPMVRWREESRAYAVLHELGTRPRTLYLARITNPPEGSS